jgi:hypothetical protein
MDEQRIVTNTLQLPAAGIGDWLTAPARTFAPHVMQLQAAF